ncbi:hypothetical protein FA95DRAFT_1641868 [Auriscalpium vulgare]|uniref:Uncharacterized protein n=1 Tax=Auriscalpium vulgare TaxID=40419 RepID=A0ACB8RBQ7_9AGAM|nr:hypothetical protein FA95DRAFT_1641868 [Auriscalpium vulgare]
MFVTAYCHIGSFRLPLLVEIPDNNTSVDKLRDIITQRCTSEIQRIHAGLTDFSVFLVPFDLPVPAEPFESLEERVDSLLSSGRAYELHPLKDLSKLLAGQEPEMYRNFVQVVVQVTPGPDDDEVLGGSSLTQQTGAAAAAPPSLAAYARAQSKPATTIYDGRYPLACPTSRSESDIINTTASPIELHCDVFARFLARLEDPTFDYAHTPGGFKAKVAQLIIAASGIYESEDVRGEFVRPCIGEVLGMPLGGADSGLGGVDDECPAVFTVAHPTMKAYVAVGECKNDIGAGGCDGTAQIGFIAKHLWCHDDVRASRENTCCPTFLLSFDGPRLAIRGGIFTDKWVAQHLAECYVGRNTCLEDGACARAARVLYALREGLRDMVAWYDAREGVEGLDVRDRLSGLHPRWYPQPTTYPAPSLRTACRQGMARIFLASLADDPERIVVVKFVERYGERVHRALATDGYAPALLYCGAVYPEDPVAKTYTRTRMVVMDAVLGPTVEQLARDGGTLAPEQRAQLRAAVDAMHARGHVHGDLRRPNVMITEAHGNVQVVDFDWAGESGRVRYPAHLRSGAFCPGVETDALIEQAHDDAMLEMHFG